MMNKIIFLILLVISVTVNASSKTASPINLIQANPYNNPQQDNIKYPSKTIVDNTNKYIFFTGTLGQIIKKLIAKDFVVVNRSNAILNEITLDVVYSDDLKLDAFKRIMQKTKLSYDFYDNNKILLIKQP